ncbi:MAG: sensor histidine kinase [Lawsonibacter sp.]|jgi:two-component system sensor histidine kinase AgrC
MNKGNNLFAAVIVLISVVALVALGFYLQSLMGKAHLVSAKLVVIIINIFTAIIVLGSLILVRKLFLLERQEKLIEVQKFYFERLQELVTVTRTQRHDFINHLQAVYALLKTDRNDEAQSYIENLYHDIRISGEIIHLSIPEVAALLLVKMGTASLKNISFAVEVESNLKGLRVKAIELNSIIGNLVDNAFEAVEVFPADKRTVRLRIFETGRHFVFQTINPGFIEKELRIKIFEPGFSTKSEKRGIGLSSVKSMVEANGGKTLVSSDKARGTKFTVIFPKKQEERRYIFHRLAASQRG